ncbi:aldo/keto reductase [Flammeovirga pectinis]|uniref:Aldo/keto reductase n=1 Tax=Flammeovirga pectinis TaxID=2494373 RepID=A0A3S9NZN7_9BACT|nr:aldo/keto reductase [Flammeovirga pectinis]AZQ61403.1 aldo/keto reductase [Flammeovirga pectinis]
MSKLSIVPFGKTNLYVSRIGLGVAALGRPGYINLGHGIDLQENYDSDFMKERTSEVMTAAANAGVTYFDTARSYGKGEQFVASWLNEQKDKSKYVVGSKWGYEYTAEWNVKAEHHEIKSHTVDLLRKQWVESVENLDDNLKIYHIHSATLESGVLENKDVLEQLWDIKSTGTIIGLSLSGPHQADTLKKALTIKRDEKFLFQSVQATYNILERSAAKMLEEAAYQGWGVIIKEAVANGRLTSRNTEEQFAKHKSTLEFIAQKHDVTIDAVAISFIIAQPWVSVVLSGASTPEQFEQNRKGASFRLDLMDLQMLDELIEEPEEYWSIRKNLEWN